MRSILRPITLIAAGLLVGASLQGCVLAAGAAAGAAGGYEAKKHGYGVQSPVRKDSAGGYKGQAPVVKHPQDNDSSSASDAAESRNNGYRNDNTNGTTQPYDNGYDQNTTRSNGG